MKNFKFTAFITAIIISISTLSACSPKTENNQDPVPVTETTAQKLNIGMLKGPTGIGAVKLMEDNKDTYNISIVSAPDEISAKLISGELDIAAIPTNMAAALYNKTEGGIKIAALNTLGVLYLLDNGNNIQSLQDLKGKTVYSTGQGATPEYILNHILKANGLENDVIVEYKSEHAELAAAMAAGEITLGILPEPNVTAVTMKNPDINIALDLTKEWENVSEDKSVLSMGCLVVRSDFLNNNKEVFDKFLDNYKSSVEYVNSDKNAASLVEKYEIMASKEAAEKAIPNCNIVYIDGNDLKSSISGFYDVLFSENPKSIGGKLPDDNFYYKK